MHNTKIWYVFVVNNNEIVKRVQIDNYKIMLTWTIQMLTMQIKIVLSNQLDTWYLLPLNQQNL